MKCVKITNVSRVLIPVQTDNNTTVYLPSGESMQNVEVQNFDSVKPFLSVVHNLTEVPVQKKSKKVKLNERS